MGAYFECILDRLGAYCGACNEVHLAVWFQAC